MFAHPNQVRITDDPAHSELFYEDFRTATPQIARRPKVLAFAKDIEAQYQKLYDNPDSVFKTYGGKFFPQQVAQMLLYALEKLKDPTFCDYLEHLDINADVRLVKHDAVPAGTQVQALREMDLESLFDPQDDLLAAEPLPDMFALMQVASENVAPTAAHSHAAAEETPALTDVSDASSSAASSAPDSQIPHLDLPRSLVIGCTGDGRLFLGGLSLSKSKEDIKPPKAARIKSRGSFKSRKDYVCLTMEPGAEIATDMVRLQAVLGEVMNDGSSFLDELRDLKCEWREDFSKLLAEVKLAQQIDSEYVAKPRLGTPYQKEKYDPDLGHFKLMWVVSIHDEKRLSTQSFVRHARALPGSDEHRRANEEYVRLTADERREMQLEISQQQIPSLFRKLAGDMILGIKALHDKDIVHGDLKLDNTLVERKPSGELLLRIADLGTAYNPSKTMDFNNLLLRALNYSNQAQVPYTEASMKNAWFFITQTKKYRELQALHGNDITKIVSELQEYTKMLVEQYKRSLQSLSETDPSVKHETELLLSDDTQPTLESIRNRIKLILKADGQEISRSLYTPVQVAPATTWYTAAPEVIKLHRHTNFCDGYYRNNADLVDRKSSEAYPCLGYDLLRKLPDRIPVERLPKKAQDVYSLGVCIFEMLYGHLPTLCERDRNLIISNPMLNAMLAADPTKRCNIDQAYELWQKWEIEQPHARTSAEHGAIHDQPTQPQATGRQAPRKAVSAEAAARIEAARAQWQARDAAAAAAPASKVRRKRTNAAAATTTTQSAAETSDTVADNPAPPTTGGRAKKARS